MARGAQPSQVAAPLSLHTWSEAKKPAWVVSCLRSIRAVEPAVELINRHQRGRSTLQVRVVRQCDRPDARIDFRELELPRRNPALPEGRKNDFAANEHQADPGVWLEA